MATTPMAHATSSTTTTETPAAPTRLWGDDLYDVVTWDDYVRWEAKRDREIAEALRRKAAEECTITPEELREYEAERARQRAEYEAAQQREFDELIAEAKKRKEAGIRETDEERAKRLREEELESIRFRTMDY